jgi:Fe2+ transport system protein FeoA
MTSLDNLTIADQRTIKTIKDDLVSEQLASFGFHIGSKLKIVSKLPFNGPITCEGNNTRIAIRAEDAANIIVMD